MRYIHCFWWSFPTCSNSWKIEHAARKKPVDPAFMRLCATSSMFSNHAHPFSSATANFSHSQFPESENISRGSARGSPLQPPNKSRRAPETLYPWASRSACPFTASFAWHKQTIVRNKAVPSFQFLRTRGLNPPPAGNHFSSQQKTAREFLRGRLDFNTVFLYQLSRAAWAAAKRATGTRYGEQLT